MKWEVHAESEPILLRDFLKQIGISRNMLKTLKYDGGQIRVNQKLVNVREQLKKGDCVEIIFPKEERGPALTPEPIPLRIIFEDEHVLVIDKQPHMATIPSLHHQSGTIANGIIDHYEKNDLPYTVHIVTRLDRDTSGLMLVAKHRYSHSLLASEKIERKYQAVVMGKLKHTAGTINAPIGRNPASIIERMVDPLGKHAVTHYQVIQELVNKRATLVNIQLETGRTHQIRVHFSYMGHPLLGDTLYGGNNEEIGRQALHCSSLRFLHPITKEYCSFHWPLALDIKQLINES